VHVQALLLQVLQVLCLGMCWLHRPLVLASVKVMNLELQLLADVWGPV
jgi:hypothetical protein